jgi:hypothetical protein
MKYKGNGSQLFDTHKKIQEGSKPMGKSLAIAYAMKRKADKKKGYDGGGTVVQDPVATANFVKGFKGATHSEGGEVHGCPQCGYADGGQIKDNWQPSGKPEVDMMDPDNQSSGFVDHEGDMKRPNSMAMSEDERSLNQHGEEEQGPQGTWMADGGFIGSHQSEDHEKDMVGQIMRQKQKMYSKGGQVANDTGTGQDADKMPNQFDDLVLRNDDMEDADYTGANSGDEIDNPGENDRRRDIVSKIMASRKKKDKLPRPA